MTRAGCVANTPHVDLSISAFKALFALNLGLVEGVEARVIADPNGASYDKKTVRRIIASTELNGAD